MTWILTPYRAFDGADKRSCGRVRTSWRHYFNFSGRSRRMEYWMFLLVGMVVQAVRPTNQGPLGAPFVHVEEGGQVIRGR